MNEDDFKAIDQRLADMSARVDRVIAKESRPMPVLKARSRPRYQLPPEELREESPSLYDGSIEDIFADFERQFDEMAQAHRQRG